MLDMNWKAVLVLQVVLKRAIIRLALVVRVIMHLILVQPVRVRRNINVSLVRVR